MDNETRKLPKIPERTSPGFAFTMVDRCLKECLGCRSFGKNEAEQVLEFFFDGREHQCVYCGSPNIARWDHLIPIAEGGETVLGNMVPACARCDDSKQHLAFAEWMTGKAKHSPRTRDVADIENRIRRIQEYMKHFGYAARPVEARLNDEERDRLSAIRARLATTREEVESLIRDHQNRVKGAV